MPQDAPDAQTGPNFGYQPLGKAASNAPEVVRPPTALRQASAACRSQA